MKDQTESYNNVRLDFPVAAKGAWQGALHALRCAGFARIHWSVMGDYSISAPLPAVLVESLLLDPKNCGHVLLQCCCAPAPEPPQDTDPALMAAAQKLARQGKYQQEAKPTVAHPNGAWAWCLNAAGAKVWV